MRILLTGATGFVGRHVARHLAEQGHFVSCMVRLGSEGRLRLPDRHRSERVSGDITDPESLVRKPLGCEAVVHLAGITREEPRWGQTFQAVHVEGAWNLIDACLEAEVRRMIHISALGAGPGAFHPYRSSKFQGEEIVRTSPMRWTVLRPAMIYGPGSPSLQWMARLTYGAPLLPVPVPARATRISPLWVGDLARGIAACLERPETEEQTLEVAGPEAMTMGEMMAALARARGVPHWQVGISPELARAAVRWLGRLPGRPGPPGSMDLLDRHHAVDPAPFVRATGVELTPAAEGMRRFQNARRGRPFKL
jgi:NADH dehydrogenase